MEIITKILVQPTEPQNKGVLWLDTSNLNSPALKYNNGAQWSSLSSSSEEYATKEYVDGLMGTVLEELTAY